MRFLFFVGCLVLAIAAQVCSGRPQDPAYGTDVEQDYVVPKDVQLSRHTWDEEDHEEYIIDTLKDISKTLREKFLLLAEKIKEKMTALRQAAGARASLLKEQLSDLKHQLEESTGILKQKVQDLFDKGQYATMGDNDLETFAKLYELRGRLNKFVHGMKDMTGEKLEKLAELVRELRHKIEKKVQELMYGSSGTDVALYYGSDEIDDEAYVIQTLRDISRTLKEKFLLLGEHMKQKLAELKEIGGRHAEVIKEQLKELKESDDAEDDEAYIIDTLKSISVALKERFATLVEKIRQKLLELKGAAGEQAKAIKEQLQNFKNQLSELREAIKQQISQLLHGSDNTPALYLAIEDIEDNKAYIIDTLKDISKTLKEKFMVLGEKIGLKMDEMRQAAGLRAAILKKQLQELKGQLIQVRDAVKLKLWEIMRPGQSAQYSLISDMSSSVFDKLSALRDKLQNFLNKLQATAGEGWTKMQDKIRDLRKEIKEGIQNMLRQKPWITTTVASTMLPSTATPVPALQTVDQEK
ncbi:hypothetical protein HPB47_010816 [Ixodes persulcatus]|uniref:Uncharacterized protein n=1 Tax=Ixodes persulcatus TaxID=34615 RepID=A0AC60NY21_IXOPE|nr:hypothetical protein HPB47_010816 [Ixodes persulcatus]